MGEITKTYLIISRLIYNQYHNYIEGKNVPTDIFVDTYGKNISLFSLWLGILYSYWRYNDYLKYSALRLYLINKLNIVPEEYESDPYVFAQPWAYEALLFWTQNRKDDDGKISPIDLTGMASSDGIGFNLYPSETEYYSQEVEIVEDTTDLDYDHSGIDDTYVPDYLMYNGIRYKRNKNYPSHDEYVIYPLLNRIPPIHQDGHYIHYLGDGVNVLPDYTSELSSTISTTLENIFSTYDDIVDRPDDYDDRITKLQKFKNYYTRINRENFIQNRLDPERILKTGEEWVETYTELPTSAITGDKRLVNSGIYGTPGVYEYDGSSWVLVENGLSLENLGFDQDLLDWIEITVGENKLTYATIIEDLMFELDVYSATIGRTAIDIVQLLLGIPLAKILLPVIEVFKPLRARFLSYEIMYLINNGLDDSELVKDQVIQSIYLRTQSE